MPHMESDMTTTQTPFTICNAQGMEVADGGIAWRGDIHHDSNGGKVGVVSNSGRGGCCDFYWHSLAAGRDFDALAARRYKGHCESADMLAGALWDAAMMTKAVAT